MIGNAIDDEMQISLWVEAIKLGRTDQAIDCGGAFATGIRTGEQLVLPTNGDGAQGTLGRIVVDLDAAIA